jgi:hypothetical protein
MVALGPSPARRVSIAILAGALSLLAVAPAAAQYLSAYKDGVEAIQAKDWDRAASAMRKAIAERGEEKSKLPVRLFLKPYLPHFYLGWALFERGDCPGALAAWAESERQGIAPRLADFEVARRGRETCGARSRQQVVAQARGQALEAIERSASRAAALEERARDAPVRDLWQSGDPSPAARHAQALELLDRARRLLAASAADALAVRRAEAFVREADAALGALDADLDQAVDAKRVELAAKDHGVDARVAEAKALLARTGYLAPYPRQLQRARADLEGLIAEAGRRGAASPRDQASRSHLDGLAARLERSIESLDTLAAAPPASLGRAADAFLAGRHAEVIEQLATARYAERRARAHARLLLAASRHALYLEGGELDEELRTAAAEDARACRHDDEALAPTERFFSPRFIAFFNQSVAAASGAPSG